MANRHDHWREPLPSKQPSTSFSNEKSAKNEKASGEEEVPFEVDEPPDNATYFRRITNTQSDKPRGDTTGTRLQRSRNESLLTRELVTSSNLDSISAEAPAMSRASPYRSSVSTSSIASAPSTAELTSDGGLTSPARTSTPSPPLPATEYHGLGLLTPKGFTHLNGLQDLKTVSSIPTHSVSPVIKGQDPDAAEAGLGRKRCIAFACGRKPIIALEHQLKPMENNIAAVETTLPDPPKRKCMLRFACPSKPVQDRSSETVPMASRPQPDRRLSLESKTEFRPSPPKQHKSLSSDVASSSQVQTCEVPTSNGGGNIQNPSQDLKKSKAMRFHEFAGSVNDNDEWVRATPSLRKKITVNDTLRKENAIRKIGDEAEEEALDEENAKAEADLEDDQDEAEWEAGDVTDEDEDDDSDGNETDNEEGFAESDEESDVDSEYQFWTPGITTAATSTDYLDHIRPTIERTASESSIESTINTAAPNKFAGASDRRHDSRRQKPSCKMRPGTPELPDSTDFVCGTLDEDRPLEAAYISCLEQRRSARQRTIPQDFDPSFPTSDPEDNDVDDDEGAGASDEQVWITGRPDDSDAEVERGRGHLGYKADHRSPVVSPKRLNSPVPARCGRALKSPPPTNRNRSPQGRRLFGQSPRRMRSPAPYLRNLKSPPSSRRPSPSGVAKQGPVTIGLPRLAQRSDLTHTKSLPRTPNPFWRQHRQTNSKSIISARAEGSEAPLRLDNELHDRGPIDIIQGLENKRQKRKEKFWRQHCRNGGKEKERRCLPGKGAERMRELGLEVAGRGKGTGPKPKLILSV